MVSVVMVPERVRNSTCGNRSCAAHLTTRATVAVAQLPGMARRVEDTEVVGAHRAVAGVPMVEAEVIQAAVVADTLAVAEATAAEVITKRVVVSRLVS